MAAPPPGPQMCILKTKLCCRRGGEDIRKFLSRIEGVYAMNVDVDKQRITVAGNVDPNHIKRSIEQKIACPVEIEFPPPVPAPAPAAAPPRAPAPAPDRDPAPAIAAAPAQAHAPASAPVWPPVPATQPPAQHAPRAPCNAQAHHHCPNGTMFSFGDYNVNVQNVHQLPDMKLWSCQGHNANYNHNHNHHSYWPGMLRELPPAFLPAPPQCGLPPPPAFLPAPPQCGLPPPNMASPSVEDTHHNLNGCNQQ